MKFIDILQKKNRDIYGQGAATAVFLGDSVTQGCFEIYRTGENSLETVFDFKNSYPNRLREMLCRIYPKAQLNVIDSGISGDNARNGLSRLERDVFRYSPDLAVVCFGLNDSMGGLDGLAAYGQAMTGILKAVTERGIECILMTPNYMCDRVDCRIEDSFFREIAKVTSKVVSEGVLETYVETAKSAAEKLGVPICDCFALWKRFYECGADIPELLSNRINHPTRELHGLFAHELFRTLFLK